MSPVSVDHLSFGYGDGLCLLRDVSFVLRPGWTAVVGANGSGKSTLLRLLSGELSPQSGQIRVSGPVALCRQTSGQIDTAVRSFAACWDKQALRLRNQLELADDDLGRWPQLSGGQRRRWEVAAALSQAPEVFLLDEPSNHLDTRARALVVKALRRFRGAGLIVTHDRELMKSLCQFTLRMVDGSASYYDAPYDEAKEQWERAFQSQVESGLKARRQQKALQQRLQSEREAHERSQRQLSSRVRMKNKHDADARGSGAKGRVAKAEARAGRRVAVSRGKVERLKGAPTPHIEKQRQLSTPSSVAAGRIVGVAQSELSVGGRRLIRDLNLTLSRGDRVWLRGDNGTGKTTLLKLIRDHAESRGRAVAYLGQETTASDDQTRQAEVAALTKEDREAVFQTAAALGLDTQEERTSEGQRRKWKLAFGLARSTWGLLLDEPTQHLDLPSIEKLQDVLRSYSGAIVVVSHDARFAGGVTDITWTIADKRLRLGVV